MTRDIVAREGAVVKADDFRKVGGGPTTLSTRGDTCSAGKHRLSEEACEYTCTRRVASEVLPRKNAIHDAVAATKPIHAPFIDFIPFNIEIIE